MSEKPADHSASGPDAGPVSYTVLDQALWNQFSNAGSAEEFAQAWLALLCRNIPGAALGLVVLGDPDTGPFTPAASWPARQDDIGQLSGVSEQAIAKRQPVLKSSGPTREVALPLIVDDALFGVCAVSIEATGMAPNDVIRQLRWGAGWIEVLLRRQQTDSATQLQERTAIALDVLAGILEQRRFRSACTALVTDLAMRLKCDPVAIGFVRRKRTKIAAVSHASGVTSRMNLMRDLASAMDEAIDQEAVVLYPANPDWDYRVTLAHEELSRTHKVDQVLTVPIQHDRTIIGAITFERAGGGSFDDETVELCDAIATIVGPVLEERRRNDRPVIVKVFGAIRNQLVRLLGPRYFGRKVATILFALVVAYFWTAKATLEITAPAILEGSTQRTVVAPFNGYLASESVRAGAIVSKGDLLAKLDDQDLALERLRLTTSRAQRETEYDQALARRERAQAGIIESQIKQADSQIALIDEQVARTRITAPFDGIVVGGDLSQSVGTTVERGEELFKIAPLDSYRVVLEVDEADIAEIELGQQGQLRLSAIPDVPLTYTVNRLTPIAAQKEGRNFFRVEGLLDSSDPRLRPSMEGVGRTAVEERLLIAVLTRRLVNWAKLAFWRWQP